MDINKFIESEDEEIRCALYYSNEDDQVSNNIIWYDMARQDGIWTIQEVKDEEFVSEDENVFSNHDVEQDTVSDMATIDSDLTEFQDHKYEQYFDVGVSLMDDSSKLLWRAIVLNDLQGLKRLLDQGAITKYYLVDGTNPIHAAIRYGDRYECVKILVTHPTANINAVSSYEGNTALMFACKYAEEDLLLVKLLVKHPDCDINLSDDYGWSPLHEACRRGDMAFIQLLVSHGCLLDVQNNNSLSTPLHVVFSRYLFNTVIGYKYKIFNIVSYLLAHGADPSKGNYKGFTPFHYACKYGLLNCAKLMHSSSKVNCRRFTPFYHACKHGLLNCTKLAKVNYSVFTPFYYACEHVLFNCAKLLYKSSKDPLINKCGRYGESPLMMAASSHNILLVEYLLSEGANANLLDENGWTALHFACKGNDLETLLLLLPHCTVIQPEDLLQRKTCHLNGVKIEIVETLLSLSPYKRRSRFLSSRLPFDYEQNVHSLASHYRSVIRRSLCKKSCSTLSAFRKELLNLNLPESVVGYLLYKN